MRYKVLEKLCIRIILSNVLHKMNVQFASLKEMASEGAASTQGMMVVQPMRPTKPVAFLGGRESRIAAKSLFNEFKCSAG